MNKHVITSLVHSHCDADDVLGFDGKYEAGMPQHYETFANLLFRIRGRRPETVYLTRKLTITIEVEDESPSQDQC